MITISGLSSLPNQIFRVPLEDGSIVKFQLVYKPSIQMWFIDIEYNNFNVKGMRVVNLLNMLTQYINIIPFGLYVEISDGTEPLLINDFSSKRVILNILTQAEVQELDQAYMDANA